MRLDSARDLCEALIKNCNLNATFSIEDIETLGICMAPVGGKPIRIILQREFVSLNNAYIVTDVALHEISHGLVGEVRENPHDEVFQLIYRRVGGIGDDIVDTLIIRPEGFSNTCPTCGTLNATTSWPDIQEFILGCVKCNEDLNPEGWVKHESGRICDLTTSPLLIPQGISTTGRNLLKGALEFDRHLAKPTQQHLSLDFKSPLPVIHEPQVETPKTPETNDTDKELERELLHREFERLRLEQRQREQRQREQLEITAETQANEDEAMSHEAIQRELKRLQREKRARDNLTKMDEWSVSMTSLNVGVIAAAALVSAWWN